MRNWVLELVRIRHPLNAGLFTGVVITNALSCFAREKLKADTQDDDIPDKLTDFSDLIKWEIFWE
jgi:hypothetical protein